MGHTCLIVSAVYPPEPLVSGRTSAGLAAALQDAGHAVGVLAPYPSRPGGQRYAGYPHRLYNPEIVQEVEVIRCASAHSSESSLGSRLWENLTFGKSSAWRLLTLRPRPAVIYANTWPLVAQGLLALVARLRGIPMVLSVQDLYPESLALQGRLNAHSRFYRLLLALDGWIARQARAVVLIAEAFRQPYAESRRVDPRRVHVVPNWVDPALWQAQDGAGAGALRERLGVPSAGRLFVYAGNIGVAAGVESLLQAWGELGGRTDLHLLIAGQGSRLEACQRLATRLNLERVHFLSPWPYEQTADVLRAADVLLLPTQGGQSLASLPSKLLDYLQAGRPVILAADPISAAAQALQESGAGWRVEPGDHEGLVAALLHAARCDPLELERLGQRGQAYVQAHFSQAACLETLVAIVELAAREEPGASSA